MALSNIRTTEREKLRAKARMYARELLSVTQQTGLPIMLEPIFKLKNINKYIIYDNNIKSDARISTTNKGFQIRLNEKYKNQKNNPRWRFTVAHEIGHTIFYDISTSPPTHHSKLGITNDEEELFCDCFASEILMPIDTIKEKYSQVKIKKENPEIIDLSTEMSKLFNVSFEAMCRRLINDSMLWNGIIFYCHWDSNISGMSNPKTDVGNNRKECWRIEWSTYPPINNLFIPSSKRIKKVYPRLRWRKIETLLEETPSDRIGQISLQYTDIANIGNLKKIIRENYKDSPVLISYKKFEYHQTSYWDDAIQIEKNQENSKKVAIIAITL